MDAYSPFMENEFIFSDFDGTISKIDVIHSFITSFSKGDFSIAEREWSEGKISTEECLNTQFGLITELKRKTFDDFINSIELDPYFQDFYKLAKENNKKIIILSDGFDIFIKTALKKYKIDIPIYSNKLILGEKNGYLTFKMEYPNSNPNCSISSGCCKCGVARMFAKSYTYVGDGLSDRCIAKKSTLLFAKKSLETFCANENIPHFPFKTFQDIIDAVCKEKNNARDDVGFINRR